jgi:hypothetical protein
MQNNAIDRRKVQDGLDFTLNHFQEPQFPRKIMTKQLGYQVEIYNKEESLEYFKSSNYEDCRINAYPSFTEYHGINRTPISFLMVDLDLKDFPNEMKKRQAILDRVLNKTLHKIDDNEDDKDQQDPDNSNMIKVQIDGTYYAFDTEDCALMFKRNSASFQ